jgi:hypothetical protein
LDPEEAADDAGGLLPLRDVAAYPRVVVADVDEDQLFIYRSGGGKEEGG